MRGWLGPKCVLSVLNTRLPQRGPQHQMSSLELILGLHEIIFLTYCSETDHFQL